VGVKLFILLVSLAAFGGFALGTRVGESHLTVRQEYITRPDARVAPLMLDVAALRREVRDLQAEPDGLDGPQVRALFEVLSGPQVPEETTTTTTTEQPRTEE
jgi:hypothetical protein